VDLDADKDSILGIWYPRGYDMDTICYLISADMPQSNCVLICFTALGRVIARNEKVEDEVAIMKYVAQHIIIPVPEILGFGKCVVGLYIVMTFIEGNALSEYLRDPSQETLILCLSISLSVLRRAYFGMAEVLLELLKPEFLFIRAIR
jgi:serine/threonine protein kinase